MTFEEMDAAKARRKWSCSTRPTATVSGFGYFNDDTKQAAKARSALAQAGSTGQVLLFLFLRIV